MSPDWADLIVEYFAYPGKYYACHNGTNPKHSFVTIYRIGSLNEWVNIWGNLDGSLRGYYYRRSFPTRSTNLIGDLSDPKFFEKLDVILEEVFD